MPAPRIPVDHARDPMWVPFDFYLVDVTAHQTVTEAALLFARQLSVDNLALKAENQSLRDQLADLNHKGDHP